VRPLGLGVNLGIQAFDLILSLDQQALEVLDPRVPQGPLEVVKLFLLADKVELLRFHFLLGLRVQGA
jgi:hypothetical protein